MLSDLSPGDRLSLKGKLFELQKKLSIIDMEDKLDNQFSFKPKVTPFDLPDRSSFLDSSNKAELIRQQKKKMLVESLANQSEETCTFTPVLYTSQIQQKFEQKRAQDIRPVYERLNEEGKKYAKEQQKRKKQAKLYDEEGHRLFTPSINRHASTITPQHRVHGSEMMMITPSSISLSPTREDRHTPIYIPPQPNTVSADEFLYQDAKDRELRQKHLILKYEEDAKKAANVHKINMSSEKLLKQRMERHSRHVFALFDRDNDERIVYEDVIAVMEHYPLFDSTEQMIKAKELFWMVVDHHKVSHQSFFLNC